MPTTQLADPFIQALLNAQTSSQRYVIQQEFMQSGGFKQLGQIMLRLDTHDVFRIIIPSLAASSLAAHQRQIKADVIIAPQFKHLYQLSDGLYLLHEVLPKPMSAQSTEIFNIDAIPDGKQAIADFLNLLDEACWFHFFPEQALDTTNWLYDAEHQKISLATQTSESTENLTVCQAEIQSFRQANLLLDNPKIFTNVRSNNPHTELLSNFSHTPFQLDGQAFESVEGFIHCIKINPETLDSKLQIIQQQLFTASGMRAKQLGDTVNKSIQPQLDQYYAALDAGEAITQANQAYVYWNNQVLKYASPQHHQLISNAITAKFQQTPQALHQLMQCQNTQLVHHTGTPERSTTSLPARVFTNILTQIQSEHSLTSSANKCDS